MYVCIIFELEVHFPCITKLVSDACPLMLLMVLPLLEASNWSSNESIIVHSKFLMLVARLFDWEHKALANEEQ
jgi:hypothetical protein